MDNLTHTLVGVLASKSGLRERFGPGTTLLLVLTSNITDIDIVLSFSGIENSMLYRRMFTHSIVGIPILALLCGWIFSRLYKNLSLKAAVGLSVTGMALHVFFDLLNSFGVVWLFPFSMARYELAWVFIIDLVLWALLAVPLLLRWYRTGVVAVVLYVALCGGARMLAQSRLETLAQQQGGADLVYAFPEALGPHRFKGVVRQGQKINMYRMNLIENKNNLVETFKTDEGSETFAKVAGDPKVKKLQWFFKAPVWTASEVDGSQGVYRVSGFDIRFISTVLSFRRDPAFAHSFEVKAP